MSDNLQATDALRVINLEAKLASQQAAHDAEIARLKEEVANLQTVERLRDEEIAWLREAHDGCLGEIDEAIAACAMKDKALGAIASPEKHLGVWSKYAPRMADEAVVKDIAEKAISATSQQVSEWERKLRKQWLDERHQELLGMLKAVDVDTVRLPAGVELLLSQALEPLRAQVAMLQSLIFSSLHQKDDDQKHNYAVSARNAISNTQAAAEQYKRDIEAKALEEAASWFVLHGPSGTSIDDDAESSAALRKMARYIRNQSKEPKP